ncbi:MAG: RidA family protein [Promethearchaeota archaeon]
MTEKEFINPGTPVAGPYTPAVKVGNLIFVSGQGPKANTEGITDQTLTAFENVKTILEAAGASVADIVKVTVFLKDINDFSKMNRAYKKFFKDNGVDEKFPARTTVQVANLPVPSMLIEIDVIALK